MIKTFSGKISKDRFLEEITKHRKADELLQGTYGTEEDGEWKGCAVACSLRSIDAIEGKEFKEEYSDHKVYETKLGIPEWLARTEDTIFEGLPKNDAMKWPERFTKAIPVGVSEKQLEAVKWKFTAVLMQENIDRVKGLNISDGLKKQVIEAIELVKALKEDYSEEDRSAARSAAWSAARSGARSAAWSAARSGAESAGAAARSAAWSAARSGAESAGAAARSAGAGAESAARSAGAAAWSAAWSAGAGAESAARSAGAAARSAAKDNAYLRYADMLIKLLEESPVSTNNE